MTTVIETPRFLLRPHTSDDAEFMIALSSDPRVTQYTGDGLVDDALARTILARLASQWEREQLGRLVVVEKATGERVGWCGLKRLESGEVDLGYRFFRRHWGQGFASETARATVAYAFDARGFPRLVAEVAEPNTASMRIIQRLGFRETHRARDGALDMVHFVLERAA